MLKKQLQNFVRQQGRKAGIQPVQRAENEAERVAWLENSGLMEIDLDNDPFISNITQLAAYISSCPKCMVNFLGGEIQHCKASHGFGLKDRLMTKEVPVDISLCQYVLENPTETLILSDKAVNPHLHALSKFPMAPQFEFYVGTPLVSSSGYTIGTLCIFDSQKNSIDHRQTESLRLLADQTVLYVENRNKDIRSSEPAVMAEAAAAEKMALQPRYHSSATTMFADFVGFTRLVESHEPGEVLEILNHFFSGFDQIIARHGLTKVKTIGDCYMVVGGVPGSSTTHAADMCNAARDFLTFVEGTNVQYQALGWEPWALRVGVHTGPVIAGYSGTEFDIWGDTVNIAARLQETGIPGRVHISQKVLEFLDDDTSVTALGPTALKNKGEMDTFLLD